MKNIFIIIVLLIPLVFSSCGVDNSIGLYVCGAFAVPGTFYPDIKGTETSCEIIETDKYDRIMYYYTAPSFISGNKERAVVICQKITSDSVYFYENVCFEIVNDNYCDFEELKLQNDWNKPLDNSKMSYRNIQVSFDNVIITESIVDIDIVKSLCCSELDIDANEILEFCIDDIQPDNTAVFYLKTTSQGYAKEYFVQVKNNYSITISKINKTGK